MRFFLSLVLLSGISFAQQLPTSWANSNEWNLTPTVTCTLGGGACTGSANSYTNDFAGLQQAVCDWVAAADQQWLIKVPHGTLITANSTGYTCSQIGSVKDNALTLYSKVVGGAMPTKFFVVDSDTPLTFAQTVCSHGTTDSTGTRQPPSGAVGTWWTGGNNGCANDIGSMWTLEGNWTPGNSGLVIQAGGWDIATGIGPSHYVFRDMEARPINTNVAQLAVVQLNSDFLGGTIPCPSCTTWQTSHVHFQNDYIHGDAIDWTLGATFIHGNNKIVHGISMNACFYCSVTFSYFDYITLAGQESHLIPIQRSAGPVKIAHNWLSGASSAVFSGGIATNDPFYFVNDVEVRDNMLTNPPSWWGHVSTWAGGQGPVIKNRLEFKTCNRCLVDGNYAEFVDLSGAQSGQTFTLTPRACSNSLQCDNYQVSLNDITITNNYCRHALVPFQMAGRSGYPANGGGSAGGLRNVSFSNNLCYDMGNGSVLDPSTIVSRPYFILPSSFGESFICSGTKSGTTITLTCTAGPTGLKQIQLNPGDVAVVTNCSDSTWNVPGGNFTTKKGATALAGTTPGGLTFKYSNGTAVSNSATGCVLGNAEGFPSNLTVEHNTVVMDTTGGGKNNGRIFGGSTGTVVTDSGCGSGPQNATTISSLQWDGTGTIVTATVASVTGWSVGISADIVEVTGTTSFNGFFYYLGQSGGKLQWMQPGTPNQLVTLTAGTAATMGTCPANNFAQSAMWKNNLVASNLPYDSGWTNQGDGNAEGCASGAAANGCSENAVDVTNSTIINNTFPGRTAIKYMEVGGAHANAIPPVTLTFPAANVCAGATANSGCLGMIGMMNGVAFDSNDANPANYGLVATSVYKAGNASQADDNTDLGVDLTALNAATISNIYTCATPCGTGPFPDSGYQLTVTISGSGSVADNLAQISCPSDCSGLYNPATVVILTATPTAGNIFSGWSGACGGTGTCTLTMNATSSATATFSFLGPSGFKIGTGVSIGTGVKIVP